MIRHQGTRGPIGLRPVSVKAKTGVHAEVPMGPGTKSPFSGQLRGAGRGGPRSAGLRARKDQEVKG
ncbi:unnamed protein product, partial [Arctogadus glacialis]